MNSKLKGNLMLLTTALIWGTAVVAQKSGMEYIGPIAFNGIRTLIAGLFLIPIGIFFNAKQSPADSSGNDSADLSPEEKKAGNKKENKLLITGGIICGLALMLGGNLQQIGLFYTTAGKTVFITSLYVVMVPLLGLFLKHKVRPVIWLCVCASLTGLYLLCIPAGGNFGHINKGDILILIGGLFFAIHILAIDYFSPKVDGVKLSCIQFFVSGILSIMIMFPLDPALGFELPDFSAIMDSCFTLCYAGILSCGVGYTLQVTGQAYTDPSSASMILCLESVFGLLAGMILLGEAMSVREVIGCIIMFAAIVVAQLPAKTKQNNTKGVLHEQK